MSIKNILLAGLVFASCALSGAQAQTVANEVTIEFGSMVVGGVGTVTVPSSSDTRSATGAIALVGSGFIQRGKFDITFTPGAQVTITAPPSVPMGGPNSPILTPTIEGGSIQTIPPGGVLTVYVGGTISYTSFGATGTNSCVISILVTPI
jgi:opacity protein-like surface antigen